MIGRLSWPFLGVWRRMVQAGKVLEPDLPDVLHRFVQHIKHLVTAVATDVVNDDAVGIASPFAMHTAGRTGETPVLRTPLSVRSSSYRRVPEFQLIAVQRPAAIQGPCGHADMRVPDFLVPKPRVNLTCYHSVFAPNSQYRVTITPGKRGKGAVKPDAATEPDDRTFMERKASMTWAQRLKRVFNIDITICRHCQGPVKIIACIEDPLVIAKILNHLRNKTPSQADRCYLRPEHHQHSACLKRDASVIITDNLTITDDATKGLAGWCAEKQTHGQGFRREEGKRGEIQTRNGEQFRSGLSGLGLYTSQTGLERTGQRRQKLN